MSSQCICLFGALLALLTLLSSVTAVPWNKCSDDFLGSVPSKIVKKMRRVYLEPFYYYRVIKVPSLCSITQRIQVRSCAQDVAPLVRVNSFNEVVVQRTGEAGKRIIIDVTAYCSQK